MKRKKSSQLTYNDQRDSIPMTPLTDRITRNKLNDRCEKTADDLVRAARKLQLAKEYSEDPEADRFELSAGATIELHNFSIAGWESAFARQTKNLSKGTQRKYPRATYQEKYESLRRKGFKHTAACKEICETLSVSLRTVTANVTNLTPRRRRQSKK